MKRRWTPDELIEHWGLSKSEKRELLTHRKPEGYLAVVHSEFEPRDGVVGAVLTSLVRMATTPTTPCRHCDGTGYGRI